MDNRGTYTLVLIAVLVICYGGFYLLSKSIKSNPNINISFENDDELLIDGL